MTSETLHIAAKDARQLRYWLGAFFAVVVLRAGLVAAGIGAFVDAPQVASALDWLDTALGVLHFGLLVVIPVQLVQIDPLVGTTAFWLTRPVSRRSLLSAKLLTVFAVLIVVPFLLDALVLAVNHASSLDVLGAIAEDTFVRLAVVLPVMALAAVTADLAVFGVAGVAVALGTLTIEVVLTSLELLPPRSQTVASTSVAVGAALTMAVSLAALAHQVVTRRTGRTVQILVIAGLLVFAVAHRWDTSLLEPPSGLEVGWFDPTRVTVAVRVLPPDQGRPPAGGLPWSVPATYALAGAPPNVVLVPLGIDSIATFDDGTTSRFQATYRQRAWGAQSIPTVSWPIASLSLQDFEKFAQHGARIEADVRVGALAHQETAALPLESRQTMEALGRRVTVRSASCAMGGCTVELVETMPAFVLDLRRPARVTYVLVNPSRHPWSPARRDSGPDNYRIFGRLEFPLLAAHLSVTRVSLKVPDSALEGIDPAWLRTAAIKMTEVRDIGSFTVHATVSRTTARD